MKRLFLTIVLVGASVAAFSQTEIQSKRGPYLTNRFFDNWFITAAGGVNLYTGTSDTHLDLGDRITPAVTASIGKWITPSTGIRFSYWGLEAKGAGFGGTQFYEGNPTAAGFYDAEGYNKEEFNTMMFHADFMWNLSAAIGGYKEKRFWEFIPYGGFGYAIASKSGRDSNHEFTINAGLINKLRLSPSIDINWEIKGMLVNQAFDGDIQQGKPEGMLATTLGLTYHFRRRGFDRQKIYEAPDYTPYNNRIRSLESDLSSSQARARQLAEELAAERNKPAQVVKGEATVPAFAVFFPLGSSVLTEKENINLGYYAAALKESGKKIKITGNADSTTGSARRNQELSKQRAQSVYDALVKAGVSSSQLEIVANGDTKEPFAKNKPMLNRVVITE